MEFADIIFTPQSQFACLRHFTEIDEEYKKVLHSCFNCSEITIIAELEKPVSKFLPSFASNPYSVLSILKKKFESDEGILIEDQQAMIYTFRFAKEDYPSGIGLDSLVHIPSLPNGEMMKIRISKHKDMSVQVLPGTPLPTWQVNLVLRDEGKGLFVKTLFPGIYAPPFPSQDKHSREDYIKHLIFWRDHAFINNLPPGE